MKKFVQYALLISILMMIVSCNDNSSSDGNGTSSDENSTEITITDFRSDEDLQIIADQALESSGWDQSGLSEIDDTNAVSVGSGIVNIINVFGLLIRGTEGDIDEELDCNEGEGTANGEGDGTFFNIDFTFNGCSLNSYTLYGEIKYAGSFTIGWDANDVLFSDTDTIMNGGVAILDGSSFDAEKYNFLFKAVDKLNASGDFDSTTYIYEVNLTLGEITCIVSGTETGSVFFGPDHDEYTCTGG